MRRLGNKVALVTGGGAGIGRAAALAFAREGASVMIGDLSAEGGAVLGEIRAAGGSARFMRCDVSEASDVEALVSAAVAAFGGLDVAFNNAGIEGMHPINRLGRPEEVAAATLWLASSEASFVTGTGMLVDGGSAAR